MRKRASLIGFLEVWKIFFFFLFFCFCRRSQFPMAILLLMAINFGGGKRIQQQLRGSLIERLVFLNMFMKSANPVMMAFLELDTKVLYIHIFWTISYFPIPYCVFISIVELMNRSLGLMEDDYVTV